MGGKAVKNRKKNEERAIQWLKCDPHERPLTFNTVTELRKKCCDKFSRPSKEFAGIKEASTLIDMLLGRADENPTLVSVAGESLDFRLLGEIMKSTFMGKLTGKRKEYCKGRFKIRVIFYIDILFVHHFLTLCSLMHLETLLFSWSTKRGTNP
jgi:hypothetical protein